MFQIPEAVSAAARPRAPSQAPQTVKTNRVSIGRLTARRLAGPTFHRDESSLRPVAVEHDGPLLVVRGDNAPRAKPEVPLRPTAA